MSSDTPNTKNSPQEQEVSFGGVVIRDNPTTQTPEILVIKPRGRKILALPKGGPEPDESPTETAEREVLEETGEHTKAREHLGDVQYWYRRRSQRIFKTVHFYLCDWVQESGQAHDLDEVDDVRWIPLSEAQQTLTYSGERVLIKKALSKLSPPL